MPNPFLCHLVFACSPAIPSLVYVLLSLCNQFLDLYGLECHSMPGTSSVENLREAGGEVFFFLLLENKVIYSPPYTYLIMDHRALERVNTRFY